MQSKENNAKMWESSLFGGSTTIRDADLLDSIMCKEKQQNQFRTWNKLDKADKGTKLVAFANTVGETYSLAQRDQLATLLLDALKNGKMLKQREVEYNKIKREIVRIRNLIFDESKELFVWQPMPDTLCKSSLTPKR